MYKTSQIDFTTLGKNVACHPRNDIGGYQSCHHHWILATVVPVLRSIEKRYGLISGKTNKATTVWVTNCDANTIRTTILEKQSTGYNLNITGPEVITLVPCSTQLSMKFYMLINGKLLISPVVFLLNSAECEIFYAYEYENATNSWHFHIYQQRKFHDL